MKKLTINRVASAGLKAGRRGYLSLAAGIFLAIFLVSSLCLAAQGLFLRQRERVWERVGKANAFLLDNRDYTDADLLAPGFYDRVGHLTVTAEATGSGQYLGWYDETARELMNRRCLSGRLPEKAGELAAESGALAALRLEDAQVGEPVTLALTPIDGREETREFTLVGVLYDQTEAMNPSSWFFTDGTVLSFPSLLVSEEEKPFATGRAAVHRALALKKGASLLQAALYEESGNRYVRAMFFVSGSGEVTFGSNLIADFGDTQTISSLIILAWLGVALILSACVAIAGAMESQLARKREEIGLLRAVGATRRQIRRIFGRESWILALFLSPLAVGAGCLFAFVLSRLAPERIAFRPSAYVLLPIAAVSALVILLAANLPLRRASRIMPMSVLRDTELLRRGRRIRPRKRFDPARLLAGRQFLLHPTRQAGSMLLVGLMVGVAALSVMGAFFVGHNVWSVDQAPAFTLRLSDGWEHGRFAADFNENGITAQDLAQLRALPHIARSEETYSLSVILEAEEGRPVEYLVNGADFMRSPQLLTREQFLVLAQEEAARQGLLPAGEDNWEAAVEDMRAAQDVLSTDRPLFTDSLYALSLSEADLAGSIVEGRIDWQALNEGREVLVYAPDIYRRLTRNGMSVHYGRSLQGYELVARNGYYYPGQTLTLAQLVSTVDIEEEGFSFGDLPYEEAYAAYSACRIYRTQVKVGAVLGGDALSRTLGLYGGCLLTTTRGLRALGLEMGQPEHVDLYLDEDVDEETEEYLRGRVRLVSQRDPLATFQDRIEWARSMQEENRTTVLVLAVIAVLFFSVSVAMITGGVSRRVRADSRMIGTLRAVGADERVLGKLYGGGVLASVVGGLVIGALMWGGLWLSGAVTGLTWSERLLSGAVGAAFAALCLGACLLTLRLSVREISLRSIVENIREL